MPTIRFLVILAPPAVLNEPLLKLVLSIVLEIINAPLVKIFPSTSNDSAGLDLLIPTLLSNILKIVLAMPFLLTCRSSELPAALLYIFAAVDEVDTVNVPSIPTVTPELFLTLRLVDIVCDVSLVLRGSILKNFDAATDVLPTSNASAFNAVP